MCFAAVDIGSVEDILAPKRREERRRSVVRECCPPTERYDAKGVELMAFLAGGIYQAMLPKSVIGRCCLGVVM